MPRSRREFLSAGLAVPAVGLLPPLSARATGESSKPEAQLQYRTLGRTGQRVTTLGFGCMLTSDASVIERAADLGVNYFDTARGYQGGNNERLVGSALKRRRGEVMIATKTPAHDAATARQHLETSLRELGTDVIDVWFLHNRSSAEAISDELVEVQLEAKKQGKVRFIGVSTHSGHAGVFAEVIRRSPQLDVILTSYNFTMDPSIEDLVQQAQAAGIGLVAMKTMAGGFRKIKPGDPLHDTIGREGALTAALRWALRREAIATTIPGIKDMEQLDENLAATARPFGAPDQRLLALQREEIRPRYCSMCGRCEGVCAKGLPVADILRYLTYAEGYGEFRLARESYQGLPGRTRTALCTDCERCIVECPSGVQVAQHVRRAQELLA